MKVAFVGLGVMGYPMAGHVQKAGMEMCVYNRTQSKSEQWCEQYGGDMARTPAAAAEGRDVILVCVGNDDDVREVITGSEGVMAGAKKGAVIIDHTTASAELARELSQTLTARGLEFLDAPVSGGQAGAENGALTVMLGGEESSYQKVTSVLDCYSRFHKLLGPAGNGQLAKMVNQICIAGVVQGLAEGLNFAMKAGLDGEALIETISKGAAGSWQMENRYKTMLADKYDFGFAVDWMRKDLGIAMAEAESNGAELPVAKLVDNFYAEVQQMGGGRWDTSSLLTRFTRR
jgi:3-hydroxyisobutyrate dehydrogenase-like beta-hydroxyacid dehydrogenase